MLRVGPRKYLLGNKCIFIHVSNAKIRGFKERCKPIEEQKGLSKLKNKAILFKHACMYVLKYWRVRYWTMYTYK